MKTLFPLCLLLFFFPTFQKPEALVPTLYQGKVRPFAVVAKKENIHSIKQAENRPAFFLPGKYPESDWHPLSFLAVPKGYRQTPYSKEVWEELKEIYKNDISPAPLLQRAYREQGLSPSLNQLFAEYILEMYPLTETICLLYLLRACFGFFSFFSGPFTFLLPFSLHTCLLGIRMFSAGRPPVSNMYETLLFVPWVTAFSSLLFYSIYKQKISLQLASWISVLLLGFSIASPLEQGLTPLQPVLNSQLWLSIHVLMVVGSYGLFFFAGALAHGTLLLKRDHPRFYTFHHLSVKALFIGLILLIGGTLLGGVWAAQSWGRFWDWDPKESWAFISISLYVTSLHAYRFKKIGEKGLAVCAIIGLIAITFTWYGVNYILGVGLHSYGFAQGGYRWYLGYLLCETFFLLSATRGFAYIRPYARLPPAKGFKKNNR